MFTADNDDNTTDPTSNYGTGTTMIELLPQILASNIFCLYFLEIATNSKTVEGNQKHSNNFAKIVNCIIFGFYLLIGFWIAIALQTSQPPQATEDQQDQNLQVAVRTLNLMLLGQQNYDEHSIC